MVSIINYINNINDRLPYFKSRETNHLPMALYALYQINANEGDIDKFRDYYLTNHDMVVRTAQATNREITADHLIGCLSKGFNYTYAKRLRQ